MKKEIVIENVGGRKIFYIDIGNITKPEAEAYIRQIMSEKRV